MIGFFILIENQEGIKVIKKLVIEANLSKLIPTDSQRGKKREWKLKPFEYYSWVRYISRLYSQKSREIISKVQRERFRQQRSDDVILQYILIHHKSRGVKSRGSRGRLNQEVNS